MENIVYYYPEGHDAHFESGHPERPERVEAIREALTENGIWESVTKLSPLNLDSGVIQTVHSPEYLNILEMTCKRAGHLEMDTYTTAASWKLANQAAGGAAAVAEAVWEGIARRGFALTRPPGHHAMHGQGMGFCLLNNIAIAADYLISKYHINPLAIIDLDLHHGNGTQDIFWKRDDVFYLSTHQSPFYPGTGGLYDIGEGPGEGWTANFPMAPGSGDTAFHVIMDEMIIPLLDQKKPQMILVSYGFDPHWMDPLGQMLLTANGYGLLIEKLCEWCDANCDGRMVLILEGGYDLNAGKACSSAVACAMIGKQWMDPYPCPFEEKQLSESLIIKAHSLWNI